MVPVVGRAALPAILCPRSPIMAGRAARPTALLLFTELWPLLPPNRKLELPVDIDVDEPVRVRERFQASTNHGLIGLTGA